MWSFCGFDSYSTCVKQPTVLVPNDMEQRIRYRKEIQNFNKGSSYDIFVTEIDIGEDNYDTSIFVFFKSSLYDISEEKIIEYLYGVLGEEFLYQEYCNCRERNGMDSLNRNIFV